MARDPNLLARLDRLALKGNRGPLSEDVARTCREAAQHIRDMEEARACDAEYIHRLKTDRAAVHPDAEDRASVVVDTLPAGFVVTQEYLDELYARVMTPGPKATLLTPEQGQRVLDHMVAAGYESYRRPEHDTAKLFPTHDEGEDCA